MVLFNPGDEMRFRKVMAQTASYGICTSMMHYAVCIICGFTFNDGGREDFHQDSHQNCIIAPTVPIILVQIRTNLYKKNRLMSCEMTWNYSSFFIARHISCTHNSYAKVHSREFS